MYKAKSKTVAQLEKVCNECGRKIPIGTQYYWFLGSWQIQCLECAALENERTFTTLKATEVAVTLDVLPSIQQ